MKKSLLASIMLTGALVVQSAQEKPNVLFIFADDMSYETVGSYGHLDIDTPNLDRLAGRSANFTQAYNMGAFNGAVCMASRAMLNSGRTVWRAWSGNNSGFNMAAEAKGGRMWSQLMKQAGYRTYMTGKWHVHAAADSVFDVAELVTPGMPMDVKEGYNRPKDEADYEAGWKPWDKKHGGFWEGGEHWSEVQANTGIKFLKDAAEQEDPFFMYLAFNAPHDPRQAPKEYVDMYPLDRIALPENFKAKYEHQDAIGCGRSLRDARLAPFPRTPYNVKVNRQEYFAIITHLDAQIGRVLETLEATGQAENTYIIFTADHGLAVGRHGLIGKQNMYEHSVRVPFMVAGPGVKTGRPVSTPIYLQDAMATALEIAGVDAPEYVEFNSVLPLAQGKSATATHGPVYGAYKGLQRMVTKDGWKMISYPVIGVERLYQLSADEFENRDLAGNPEYAGKLNELREELYALSERYADPLDYDNPRESWLKADPPKVKNKGGH